MDFFSGFKWAVPHAFADAISTCFFEEGDILYDTTKAYGDNWCKASKFIGHSIQIMFPARITTGEKVSGAGVFQRNWKTEVRLDLYDKLKKVSVGQIYTTQGRLYTALWTGELDVLDKKTVEPPIPSNVRDVTKLLKSVVHTSANHLASNNPAFIMARDWSSQVSRDKYFKIYSKLKNHQHKEPLIKTPEEVGFEKYLTIAPSVEVVIFITQGISRVELGALIKDAVYVPTVGAKKDMFRIEAHGAIF